MRDFMIFITRYNNADGSNMNHFGDVYLLVYSTGNVLWVPPAQFQAFCKVDLRMWPHESPSCKVGEDQSSKMKSV